MSLASVPAVAAALSVAVHLGGRPLPWAVVGHEGSPVLVALNGLRLLAFRERPAA